MKVITTEIVNELKAKIKKGKKLTRTENIFYLNDVDLRKANISFSLSHEELIEYAKCYTDKIYFIENYLDIKLYDFQKDIISHYDKNRFSIFMKSDQIGFGDILSSLQIHDLIFMKDKTIMYIDNKDSNALEFLNIVKRHYKKLPFFIKPGVLNWNMKLIHLDNGCRINARKTSSNVGIGFQIHSLIISDFAYIIPNIKHNYSCFLFSLY